MKEFKKGEKVKVFGHFAGRKFFEGIAVVDKKSEYGETLYNICFIKTGYWCIRDLCDSRRV